MWQSGSIIEIMEHSAIIQTMCRIGLGFGDDGFRRQVERLRDRLAKGGEERDAASLTRLLEGHSRVESMEPTRARLSRALVHGEELRRGVQVPVDRDTSAALADVIFPGDLSLPELVLPLTLSEALESVMAGWSRFEALQALGVAPSRTCLLFGAPGTGKTATALTIAKELALPVVVARLDGIVSSFLGTTARNIANIFEFANRYRCVLLLDEFDALAKLRDDPQEVGEIKRVVNTLLQNLDRREEVGITIATTNHPSLLDPAVWRRFEVRIEMPLPDHRERRSMIAQFMKPLESDDVTLDFLAWVSCDETGAELKTMVNTIKREIALRGDRTLFTMKAGLELYARTSASLKESERMNMVIGDERRLARALLTDADTRFTQTAVASILHKDQGTISRWVREEAGV